MLLIYFYLIACYREFTSWSGDVVSPNYPDDYLNNLDCYFIIRCPFIPGFRIKVEFKFFSLEDNCVYDSLTLYDGITTSAKKLGNSNGYCGNSLPPRLYASSNQMLITFKTDNAHVRKGFSLKFNYVRSEF